MVLCVDAELIMGVLTCSTFEKVLFPRLIGVASGTVDPELIEGHLDCGSGW
jgi:hypothetical protein